MQIYQQTGPTTAVKSLSDSAITPVRSSNLGETVESELHGRYYEGTVRRNRFSGSNSASGITTSAGTTASYTGLCLSNALGNSVNLVLEKVGFSFSNTTTGGIIFPAAAAIGLMTGQNNTVQVVHTIPASSVKCKVIGSSSAPQGTLDISCTLPTAPTVDTIFGMGLTGATNIQPGITGSFVDLEGSIVIPPGGYVALFTSSASSAAALFASFEWEEVPI